ncbi:hypothetical protein [Halomicrobium urmianum]|uniref:hypothetical protein n=1 Tax=Halomicrobium urmianum TaxID=1586233 RepID=UPI001CD9D081|nr:hypothetical protein [Halomicrobium urmianum]
MNAHTLDVPDSGLRKWLSEWAAEVEGDDPSTPTPSDPDETAPSTPPGLTVTETTASSITWSGTPRAIGAAPDSTSTTSRTTSSTTDPAATPA